MKKLYMVPMITIALLSGCADHGKTKEPKNDVSIEGEVKEVVDDFVDGFVEKDYQRIVDYYSEATIEETGYNKKALAQRLERNFKEKNIEIDGYDVEKVEEFKEKTYVEFDMDVTYGNDESGKDKEKWLISKNDGDWKFDSSLIVKEFPLDITSFRVSNPDLSYEDIHVYEHVDGYRFEASVKNTSDTKSYQFGNNEEKAKTVMITSAGESYEMTVEEETIFTAGNTGETTMFFEEAEGDPFSIFIKGIYEVDEGGKPMGEPMDVEIMLDQTMLKE